MRWISVFAAIAFVSVSVTAAAKERAFAIGDEKFSQKDIVDARAQPDTQGTASVMLSFEEAASARIEQTTLRAVGKSIKITLDGQILAEATIREPILGGQFILTNGQWKLDEATALAKRISGKDPLPDSLDDEGEP